MLKQLYQLQRTGIIKNTQYLFAYCQAAWFIYYR